MVFTYDRTADREVLRFTGQGIMLGLITGAIYGGLALLTGQPLWAGVGFALLLFVALFPSVKWAKILYWNLAILLQAAGIITFGVLGALGGLCLWFVALAIVPGLRYVLQRENIISVSTAAVVAWLLTMLIWGVSLTTSSRLAPTSFVGYLELCVLIGTVFWGLAKIISSSFKEYHYRQSKSS